MGRTLAQRYWSDFERLAFELTKDCFNLVPTRVLRTRDSKDGGFDAVFTHELGQLESSVIAHEVLMEAKFRTGREAVGLRAFAATMIIAFNGKTQCLVVVSNRAFSPQALSAARDFQWKSRLQVILVNQRTLSAWVRPRVGALSKRFPKELLEDLVLPNESDETLEELDIPEGADLGSGPRGRFESGRTPDGGMARCEIVLSELQAASETDLAVTGPARRQTVHDLAAALETGSGCALVLGESGSGKSHVIRAAVSKVFHSQVLGFVDLAQTLTCRQLFLVTVAQILGIEISAVAREFTFSDCRRIFSTVGGTGIPDDVANAVVEVIVSATTDKHRTREIDQIHLCRYISVAAARTAQARRILVFHNLDKTTAEALEFLHAAIPALTANQILVVVEVATGGDTALVGQSSWKRFVPLFQRTATLGQFHVPVLTLDGAIELLLEQLPGLGRERAKFICERVGNRPLFLHHAALWLKKRGILQERSQGTHLLEDPEIFFEGIRPEVCISILDRHIDLWRHDTEFPFADAITTATFLNGRLSLSAAQIIAPENVRPEALLDAAVSTGLFVPEPRLEGVRVSHSLLLERMVATDEGRVAGYGGRHFERKRVANLLLDALPNLVPDSALRYVFGSALLKACGRWSEAWDWSTIAGKAFAREFQLSAAAEAFQRSVEVAERAVEEGDEKGESRRVDGLLEFLEIENQRYRLGLHKNEAHLKTLTTLARVSKLFPDRESAIFLRTGYLRWRAAFTQERFDEALPIARNLFEFIGRHPETDPELAGSAIAALGITLKALEQSEDSIRTFDEGLAAFPSSICGRMEQLSNLGALALRDRPGDALTYLEQILEELGSRLSLLDRIHTEVDVSMALFLASRWDDAVKQAIRSINLADANGIPAQGARAHNILGCIYWCRGALDDARLMLDRAVQDAERSYMERFLWRFHVNQASIAAEAGDIGVALASARWAEDRLVGARRVQWSRLGLPPSHITSRWYVALLAIGLIYDRCGAAEDVERLLKAVASLPRFAVHLEQAASGTFPHDVFSESTHLHEGRITITG